MFLSNILFERSAFRINCISKSEEDLLEYLLHLCPDEFTYTVSRCKEGTVCFDISPIPDSIDFPSYNLMVKCLFTDFVKSKCDDDTDCTQIVPKVHELFSILIDLLFFVDESISIAQLLSYLKNKEVDFDVLISQVQAGSLGEINLERNLERRYSLKDGTVNEFDIDLKDFEVVLSYLVKYRGSNLHFEFDYKKVLCTVDSLYNGTNYSKLFGSMPLPEFLKVLGTKSFYADSKLNQTVYDFLVKSERNMFKLSIVDDTVNPATAGSIGCKE